MKQDPNQFDAQLVKVDLAMQRVAEKAQKGNNSVNSSTGLIGTLLTGGVALSQLNSALTEFKNEAVKLANIFRRICEVDGDSGKYLRMSSELIELGDIFQDIPSFPGGRPNLYAVVISVPIEKMEGMGQQVSEIRRKAEGRSLIFKPN